MRLSENLVKEINIQINKEFYSEHYYLAMAAYFAAENLPGFANFFVVQSEEEHFHAMKLFNYVNERGGKVELMTIEQPRTEFSSALEVFKLALEHEMYVTDRINNLMDVAIADNDHASKGFLQWFVDEQVEEEASMEDYVNRLERIGDHGYGLFMLDKELAGRTFTPPAGE